MTKHKKSTNSFYFKPQNNKQLDYWNSLETNEQTIVFGPAGTSKTYTSSSHAAKQLIEGSVKKIVITRPHVSTGKDIGYLPGNLEEKCVPWAIPVLEVLQKHLGKSSVEKHIKDSTIEIVPLALMRGRSFSNTYILVDESQNMTMDEIKMLLTRVGEKSKIVINGDIQQTDLKENSGLKKLLDIISKNDIDVGIIEFKIDDIVRSNLTKQWIKIFTHEGI